LFNLLGFLPNKENQKSLETQTAHQGFLILEAK